MRRIAGGLIRHVASDLMGLPNFAVARMKLGARGQNAKESLDCASSRGFADLCQPLSHGSTVHRIRVECDVCTSRKRHDFGKSPITATLVTRSSVISAKVFVGNLNYRTTKEELSAFLSPAGEIVDAFLPTDRESGRPRGFGFVTFATEEQATKCIEQFDGADFGGRRLNINKADDRGRGKRGPKTDVKRGGGSRPESKRGRPGFKPGARPGGPGGKRPPRAGAGAGGAGTAPPSIEPEYDTEDRRWQEDEGDDPEQDEWGSSPSWKKKKKKRKGSRRGLRAKKRSL